MYIYALEVKVSSHIYTFYSKSAVMYIRSRGESQQSCIYVLEVKVSSHVYIRSRGESKQSCIYVLEVMYIRSRGHVYIRSRGHVYIRSRGHVYTFQRSCIYVLEVSILSLFLRFVYQTLEVFRHCVIYCLSCYHYHFHSTTYDSESLERYQMTS